MATVTYVIDEGTNLSTSVATLYTAPSTVLVSIIRLIVIMNSDSAARQVRLYKLPASGSSNTASMIRRDASNNTIAAGKSEQWDTAIFVAPSGTVTAAADAADVVSVHMSILEISS